jgi:hypothetical protein
MEVNREMADATSRPIGSVSTDGQFEWSGTEWVPRGSRGASAWTRPMQVTAAVYLLVLAVGSLTLNFVLGGDPAARLRQSYLQTGMAPDQAQSLAHTMSGVLLAVSAVFAVVYIFLSYASYRGWGWAFWLDGVVLVLGSFSAFSNLSNLLSPAQASIPLTGAFLSETLSILALGLLCWFVISFFRFGFGSWARPKGARVQAG